MIKHINHQNFQTTPFVAAKYWRLFNTESDDLVILEPTGSEDTVALEFIDYTTGLPFLNTGCSIALEQQGNDRIIYQEAETGSGTFYPESEATNADGTFKRLVHTQVKATFYNKFSNPTQIFGVEYIDFPLGRTFRDLSDFARIFTIPRGIFGERVIENTVHLMDNSLDDNVNIQDDGYQNLIATANLFSKVQEVRFFGNIIMSGTSSFECFNEVVGTNEYDEASISSIGFLFGSITDFTNLEEETSNYTAFYTGSLDLNVMTSSEGDTGSNSMAFYTGSLIGEVVTSSANKETGSADVAFYTGSLFTEVVTGSLTSFGAGSGSLSFGFLTGSTFNEFETASRVRTFESSSLNMGFLNGTLT